MSLFVDTSVWYAAADSSDSSNARAKAILAAGEPLVTSDHVLVETWTLLRYRIRRQAAEHFWEAIRNGVATIELEDHGSGRRLAESVALNVPGVLEVRFIASETSRGL